MQPRQHLAISPVRLHAIPAPLGNHRRTHHDAVLASLRQMPIDPEAARPGLVDEVESSVRRAQRAHDLVERLEVARDDPVVADFSLPLTLSNRDVDRFLVDIQPYEHATVPHDLPPRAWCCLRSVRYSASSTMYGDGRSILPWRDLSSMAGLSCRRAGPPSKAGPA